MKKCCELPYLAMSEEMQIFLRPNGDVEKQLSNQANPKTYAILQVYRKMVPVQESWSERDIQVFTDDINNFILE